MKRLYLGSSPVIATGKEGTIWIHALSVGEVISAVPLTKAIREEFPHKDILFTVTTCKGMEMARKHLSGTGIFISFFPIDFWWSVLRFVEKVRPCAFVLVETDIWPGILHILKKKGVISILVNGRISPRTHKSYMRYRPIVKKIFDPFTYCLMQSPLDSSRLISAGIPRYKVITAGNIKFDRQWVPMTVEEEREWRGELGLSDQEDLWVAGSIHPGEEKILLEVHRRLLEKQPDLHLILAPRRLEMTDSILRRAADMGIISLTRTRLRKGQHYHVLILDTMGELERIYGLALFSFVGGSLVPFGGHNLLEPASFGSPVLFGPHTHNFTEMTEGLLKAGGGLCVRDGEELFGAAETLLKDEKLRDLMGDKAARFVFENRGAIESAIAHIHMALDG